jgi:hypothetical protein
LNPPTCSRTTSKTSRSVGRTQVPPPFLQPTISTSGPEGGPAVTPAGFSSQAFVVSDEKSFPEVALTEDPASAAHGYDKSDLSAANVAKVRPQQQQQQQQQHQQQQQQQQQQHMHHQHLLQQQLDNRNVAAYNRLLGSAGGLPALHSPPSILNQPPSLYQAFQMDPSRGVANPIYSTYHGLSALSAADLFGPPPANNQFRMPTTNAAGQYPGGQSTASQVLLSQSLMSSGGMKAANQVSMLQYFFFSLLTFRAQCIIFLPVFFVIS